MKTIDLYVDAFLNAVTGGEFIRRDRISALGLRCVYDRYLTHDWETKFWVVQAFPVHYDNNLTEGICHKLFKEFPEVESSIYLYCTPVHIGTESQQFTKRMSSASAEVAAYQEYFKDMTPAEKLLGKVERNPKTGGKIYLKPELLDKKQDRFDSFSYIYSTQNGGGHFANSYYVVQGSCKNIRTLRAFGKRLVALCKGDKIHCMEVRGSVDTILKNFTAAGYLQEAPEHSIPILLSEEAAVSQLPIRTKGLLNSSGILMGIDWETKLPFFLDFFESPAAQINLLLARSGYGKTYNAFNIILMAAGCYNVHSSVLDIKGNEHCALLNFMQGIRIDMGGASDRFVNTLRLDDLAGRGLSPEDCYSTAVNGTVTLMSIVVNLLPSEGNAADLQMMLQTSVRKVYSIHNVRPDNELSFQNSAHLQYSAVITQLESMKRIVSYTDSQRNILALAVTRLEAFFSADGEFGSSFRREITIGEVLDAPLVIYEMHKNTNATLSLLDNVRVFMLIFLDGKKQAVRKSRRQHTFAFYEELQRCGNMEQLVAYISGVVTGSRSSNVSVFLLLNAVKTLNGQAFNAIKSNITTKIVGDVISEDIQTLVEEFDCQDVEDKLLTIHNNISGEWNNCFAISYNTGRRCGTAIYKPVLPEAIAAVLKTRDTSEEDKEKE